MDKLVILRFGPGSLETGFPVTLRLGPEGERAHTELTGALPPLPDLGERFTDWQGTYRRLDFSGRPLALKKTEQTFASPADCQGAAQRLGDRLNHWLRHEDFRLLRETWLEKLQPNDMLRVVIQTQELALQRLPWHLWELLERYSRAEVVISAATYDRVEMPEGQGSVKILALLGNRTGIDIERDRTLLEALPNADVSFLVEPSPESLTDQLWCEPWQILFFAGHSASLGPDAVGKFGLNPTDSLTIAELKYALRNAVSQGLQLAIFNSCDGLGLARELADLQIPQLIVMREPVPDRVAQAFLQYLLAAFCSGLPLHLAVRQARERLQGLEKEFPCATWLPVLFQNLAQPPVTWRSLLGSTQAQTVEIKTPGSGSPAQLPTGNGQRNSQKNGQRNGQKNGHQRKGRAIATSLAISAAISTAIATATIGLRRTGLLQPLELHAYDHLLTRRPAEARDPRLLVVTVTETDVQNQPERGRSSLSDAALAQAYDILQQHQPALIGLDIYRDFPVDPRYPELAQALVRDEGFVGICRVATTDKPAIDPPPELSGPEQQGNDRVGFSDVLNDPDGAVRRQLLAMTPPVTSSCQANFSIGLELALRYLALHNVSLEENGNGDWYLGQGHIHLLDPHTGPYQGIDAWGYQTLLNYRKHNTLDDFTAVLTLGDLLSGQFNPEVVRDRIVLIGTTAESFKDYTRTPYGSGEEDLAGVILQAQMTSQIVSAALEGRPLIWTMSFATESLWILLWAGMGSAVVWVLPGRTGRLMGGAIAAAVLYAICFGFMHQRAGWLPLVPPLIALLGSGAGVGIYRKGPNPGF